MKIQTQHYYGGCPECGDTDGFINVGRGHWFYCSEHRVKWSPGENLISGWREQTEDEQRRIYNAIGLGDFIEVEEMPWRKPLHQHLREWRCRVRSMFPRRERPDDGLYPPIPC